MTDLLELAERNPEALICAGNTYIGRTQAEREFRFPGTILYIGDIEELKRITRTERYLEIGACASIKTILDIGKKILSDILYQALQQIGTPGIKSLATLGGNLCAREERLDSFPVLLLLDAKLEIRSTEYSTWVPINRFVTQEGGLVLSPGEVLTRIRLPLETWDYQFYRKLPPAQASGYRSMSFCGLVKTQRDLLVDFRTAIGGIGKKIIRSREFESELIGRRLPLSHRETMHIISSLNAQLSRPEYEISSAQKERLLNCVRLFLHKITSE